MIKDRILQILSNNKDRIMDTFSIDENGMVSVKEFFSKDHKDFKDVVDSIFMSDMGNREKMVAHYMIGYANGSVKRDAGD